MAQPEISPLRRGDARRAAILDAAIAEFSERGVSGASMHRIAAAAGISRPGLYQYFANKDEILAAGFVAVFESHAERAVRELHGTGTTADCLDGFVQRFHGDLWELLAASPHIDEIVGVKTGKVADDVYAVLDEMYDDLAAWFAVQAPGASASVVQQRSAWTDMIRLSPMGLRSDSPSLAVFRARLSTMARSVAAMVEAHSA